jgi:cytochrome c-type biogenesis protein CcmH/NrfG
VNTYARNLQALGKRHAELVERLQHGVDTGHITVQQAHSGVARLLVTTPAGEQIFVHNEADPLARARETADKLPMAEGGLCILLGFGLGYLALEIFKKLDKKHFLLICEADLGMFHTALGLTEMEPLLLSEQVKFLVGEDISVAQWLAVFGAPYLDGKALLVQYAPCCRLAPERYQRLEKQVVEQTQVLIINTNTLLALGRLTMENQFANIPWVLRSPGVQRLANLLAGRPGIVVAAGPSLEKNFLLLKEVKRKAVIIAVDTVLPLLLSHGILPDIVVTLDPQEINYTAKFRDLALDPNIPLVYTPQSYPEIVKNYPGKKFTTAMLGSIYQRFAAFWEEKGNIVVNAQSVTHVAFNLAQILGVDPIVFVGLDLCFAPQKTHAANLGMATDALPSDNAIWTTDIFGERVRTLRLFKSFQHFFEQVLQHIAVCCINATEGGIRLAGAQVMRLREVIDVYCQVAPLDIAGTINAAALAPETSDVPGLLAELRQVRHQARTMLRTSRKILRYVRGLQQMQDASQTTHPRYVRLSALAEKATAYMREQEDLLNLLPSYAYRLELYMSQPHVIAIDSMEEGEERFTRQIERAQVYYQGLVEVLDPFVRALGSLMKHLETEQAVAHRYAQPGAELRRALEYKELGHYEDAIALCQQRLQAEPMHAEALYHLAAIYMQQGRYRDTLSLIEKDRHGLPHGSGLHQLYDACRQKIAHWEEQVRQVQQSGPPAEHKDPIEALLEAGNFYFRAQELERARTEYERVLALRPDLPEAYYHLAHTHFATGDFVAGVAALEETLRRAPDNPVVYRDLGLVASAHGEYHQAERFFQKAIELKPDDAALYESLGDVYVRCGAWLQAAQAYEALLGLEPQRLDVLQTLAGIYQKHITAAVEKH